MSQPKQTWTKKIRALRIVGGVAFVPLSNGMDAIIDAEDTALVEGWNWSAAKTKSGQYYAQRGLGAQRVRLHDLILDTPPGMLSNHKSRDTLDCRRANLRPATKQQNAWNRSLSSANTSGFKGVTFRKDRGTWLAIIQHRKLGTFKTAEAAARAYDVAAAETFGEFAVLNFSSGKFNTTSAA